MPHYAHVTSVTIRPFDSADYERIAALALAIDPTMYGGSAEALRRRDAAFNPAHRRVRLVAERDGQVVGWGQVGNRWWAYHPRTFQLRLEVDPAFEGQGIGGQLFARFAETLTAWDPLNVRTETGEQRGRAIRFLEDRGFVEIRRRWQSVLTVAEVDLQSFATARQRVRDQPLTITTYAAERERRGDRIARDLFDLEMRAATSEPGYEPGSSMDFEQFRAIELETDDAIPEASFLALDGARLVGVSRLGHNPNDPSVLQQEFTGTDPDYLGRGIALALKLLTVEYARSQGFREIRTQNDTANGPMLHINDRLGFKREPGIILFERVQWRNDAS